MGPIVRYLVALAIAMTACAGLSYAVVRHVTRDMDMFSRADEVRRLEATELRTNSRILAELSNEWFVKASTAGTSPGLEVWIERNYIPRLNDLRQRLVRAAYPGDAVTSLVRAADILNTSVGMPQDIGRRQHAAEAVLHAISDAERRVAELGANPNDLPPPVPAPELGERE